METFSPDDGRLAELILYIADRCSDWEGFNALLLDRILFQADFMHYRAHGRPITGQAYRRGPAGPSPRGLSRVLRGLARAFAFEEIPAGDGLHVRRRPRALRAARPECFGDSELAAVDEVIGHYRGRENASDPLTIPWEGAAPREVIPYPLALLAPESTAPRKPEAVAWRSGQARIRDMAPQSAAR